MGNSLAMFRIKKIKHYIVFVMKKYKLKVDGNEYLVTIEADNGAIVTTKDAHGNYRNILKSQLVEI